ncbi:MAG TPA: adenosine deaminase [Trebonia sp.]|nr:adenosine deaminase [Trebonia sp.]
MTDFVTTVPKAELHLHVEGALEPELAFTLAARNGLTLPFGDVASLRRAYQFTDLQSFLDLYYACMGVLRTEADFRELAAAYLARAKADGVTRVEMFFDPQAHVARGVPLATVIGGLAAAALAAAQAGGPTVGLIACLLRDAGPASALATVESLAEFADALVGIGLDSTELGYPPADYRAAFELAGQLGLRKVAHAGEEGPADFVWQAIDVLGAERVDHGIRSVEDRALLRRLAADRTPLTVCPLSNVRLKAVPSLAAHPLPVLLDAGVHVTVNSDDPAYFGGYIADNYRAVAGAFGLGEADVRSLAEASLAACFT